MENRYKCLSANNYSEGNISIVPIRYADRFKIMHWRNEQIYHLRQLHPLTERDQENYFRDVISKIFDENKPNQVLFSYLQNGECIGYGGLVHINWQDQNAEISFIMDTLLERTAFHEHWVTFLNLIERVAFSELRLHKIYTYAFDVRPHLYISLESAGFSKEAVLKEHCKFNGEFIDVVIHMKKNMYISIRRADLSDMQTIFRWANDPATRKNSFDPNPISLQSHEEWWSNRMASSDGLYLIAEIENTPAGIIRFDKTANHETIIGINIAPDFRGMGYSSLILSEACKEYFMKFNDPVVALIKKSNIPSIKIFEKAGFRRVEETIVNEEESFKYLLNGI